MRPRSPQDGWSPLLAADKAGGDEGPGTGCLASSSLSFPNEEEPTMSASFTSQYTARCPTSSGCSHKEPL